MGFISEYTPMFLTSKGLHLEAKVRAGITPLKLKRAIIGEGYLDEGTDLLSIDGLVAEVPSHQTGIDADTATVDFDRQYVAGDGITMIGVRVQNGNKEFPLREIAIIAEDPDEGDIIYSYVNFGDYANMIMAFDGVSRITRHLAFPIVMSNTENVKANITYNGEVSFTELQKEIDDRKAADNELKESKADKQTESGGFDGGANAKSMSGAAVGAGANTKDGFAGGKNAQTGDGVAIGKDAKTVDAEGNPIDAIQLGAGTNTEEKSLQVYNHKLMSSDGTIPIERIPDLGKLEAKFVDSLPTSFIDGVPTAVERCTVSSDDEGYTITSGGNAANKYGLAHIDFSSSAADATSIVIEMDTKVPDTRWLIGFVDLSQRPAESYRTTYDKTGVIFTHGTQDGNYYWVNGNNKWNTTFKNNWLHVRAIINFSDKTVQYEITEKENGVTVLSGTEAFIDTGVTTVTGIEFYTWVNDTTMGVYNINIIVNHDVSENTLYIINHSNSDMYIYRDNTPVYLSNNVAKHLGNNPNIDEVSETGVYKYINYWGEQDLLIVRNYPGRYNVQYQFTANSVERRFRHEGSDTYSSWTAMASAEWESKLEELAPIDSPEFTGTPQVPTAKSGDNSLQVANTEFVANAVNHIVASGMCGDNVTWTLDKYGLLTVSGSGTMTGYTQARDVPWYLYANEIIEVKVEKEVQSVGTRAFMQCPNLQCVTILNNTGYEKGYAIGGYAFYECTKLSHINVPNYLYTADTALDGCTNLTGIYYPFATSADDCSFFGMNQKWEAITKYYGALYLSEYNCALKTVV